MYGVTEMTTLFIFCYQELMGIGCNGTWQESDPDACLQVTAMFTAGGPDVEIHRNSAVQDSGCRKLMKSEATGSSFLINIGHFLKILSSSGKG